MVAGWFEPLCDRADPVRFHYNNFWHDNETNKTNLLLLEFALRQLHMEAFLLKLHEDELDMLSVLLRQI